jgi:hypothetical protein
MEDMDAAGAFIKHAFLQQSQPQQISQFRQFWTIRQQSS